MLGSVISSLMAAPLCAQTPPVAQAEAEAEAGESGPEVAELSKIVVVGKRPMQMRDIPGSVSVMGNQDLQTIGAQSMADYVTRTPGVVFNQGTPGNSTVTVRGVSTGQDQGQGTTGYFINEAPLTDPGFSIGTPDIDTFDVENVVVLRGPQGSLFGSGSLGGAINYQATRPEPTGFSAHLQGTAETVSQGGDGGAFRAMVNVPLATDTLAVRGVYYNRDIAGYLDNVGTGVEDANETRIEGGRVQVLWQPIDGTSLNYMYLQQETENRDGMSERTADAGRLRSMSEFPENSRYETRLHNLRFDHELSFGTITALATHHEKENLTRDDATQDLSEAGIVLGPGPVLLGGYASSRGKTYELRLASAPGDRYDYIVGVMHNETDQSIVQFIQDPGSAEIVDTIFGPGAGAAFAPDDVTLFVNLPIKGRETALFGEFNYRLNDHWKATVGGRAFFQKVNGDTQARGLITQLLTGTSPFNYGATRYNERGLSPKASITWTPSQEFMAYALVSKGFRIGGPNPTPSLPGQPVPVSYDSDSLINYELGFRADLLDSRLLLDVTGFYIDWDNIQLRRQTSQALNFGMNAGAAEIFGVEASATFRLTQALSLQSSVTWMDATLGAEIPAYPPPPEPAVQPAIPAGSGLPGASDWLVSNTLIYRWAGGSRLRPSLVLSHRYAGEAQSAIGSNAVEGDYHVFDARLRLDAGRWGITGFVSNIGDRRGVVQRLANEFGMTTQQTYTLPRTIGVTIDVYF